MLMKKKSSENNFLIDKFLGSADYSISCEWPSLAIESFERYTASGLNE